MTTGLQVNNVRFAAGGREILQGVSLNVRRGETLALLGPSGSGKTTLLRVVAGLERALTGDIRFDGVDVTSVAAHRRGFGMMFQEHALFPHLDVAGNVEFGLRQARWSTERRVARRNNVLELVGLDGFAKRSIERLSGGERQRVALARALAPGPGLLMLDEPLGSLDRSLRERLAAELRAILGGLDVTVVYVTHDQSEAFTVADQIAIMNDGRVVRTDSPQELWNEPKTEFVARFLGMENVVRGTRDRDGAVETAFGAFGPIEGAGGPVSLLIRGERVEPAAEPGLNVVTGTLAGSAFRGATISVEVAAGDEQTRFELPTNSAIPEIGSPIHLRVTGVQVLSSD